MTTLDSATRQLLQQAVYAYMQQYGGKSLDDARAIAGALLTVREKAGGPVAQGLEIEQWVDILVSSFDTSQLDHTAWAEPVQHLASQIKNWRDLVETQARNTLDAYIQAYTPELDSQKLQTLVTAILPIVEDATITRDEARRIIALVGHQFNMEAAIARVIDPQWIRLAEKAAQLIELRDVETTTTEAISAYIHQFQPTAIAVGPALIEQAVQAISNNKVKLGIEVDLDPDTRRLLVKQVMLQLRLKTASPPPTKTALEIAHQLRSEVERFRHAQGFDTASHIPKIVTTNSEEGDSILGGELSIGLDQQPTVTSEGLNATETTNND